MGYLEEIDPDVERAGLARRKVSAVLAQYAQLPYENRREASWVTLNASFSKASLPEASASDKPPASDEAPARDEPQPGTSTGKFTHVTALPSNVDDPDVI